MSPVYLRSADGRRLLSYLFGLHPSLVLDFHAVMKEQMFGAKRSVLVAYGEVGIYTLPCILTVQYNTRMKLSYNELVAARALWNMTYVV